MQVYSHRARACGAGCSRGAARRVTARAAGAKQACQVVIDVRPTEAAVGARLCELFANAARDAIAEKGSFVVAVPGGSVLKMLGGLKEQKGAVDWSKVHLFYVNHKVLPHSDQASTHKKALEGFARSVGLPEANVAAPLEPAPGQDLSAAASAAASDYESRLRAAAGSLGLPLTPFPRFDWMLLGTGADGHVGSLYPNKPTLDEKEAWVIPFQKSAEAASITLSLPVMAAGREVVVCLTGAKKAPAARLAVEGGAAPGVLPVAMVAPAADAKLTWLLDEAAAAELGGKH